MRLGKTAAYHFASQVVISLSGFAATFAIATVLGSTDLGLYTTAVAIGFFWLAVPASGISQAIKKRMSEGTEPERFFSGGVLLNGFVAVCLGTAVLLFGLIVENAAAPDIVIIHVITVYNAEIATLLVGATALQTSLATLEGEKSVARAGALNAFDRVGRSAIQIALIAAGFGVTAITFGHAAMLIFAAVIGIGFSSVVPVRPRWEHVHSLLNYARYAWIGALRGRVYGWFDIIVLSAFLGSASLIGIYELAWGIGSLLATASSSISTTLFPEVSELSVKEDFGQITHYLDEAIAFSGLVVLPGLAGATVIGPRILRFYRPEYVQGATVLTILIGAYVADVYASQFLNVVNAIDRPDVALRVNVGFIMTNVVLNIVLVWYIGWTGAALATVASAVVRAVGGYMALYQLVGQFSLPVRTLGAQSFAAIIMALIVKLTTDFVPKGRIATLALVGFGAAVYFVALFALSGRIRAKTMYMIETLQPART